MSERSAMRRVGLVPAILVALVCVGAGRLHAQAHEPDHPVLDLAVASYMVLQGVDNGLTQYLLGSGQGREVNPLLAPFSQKPVLMSAIKMSAAVGTSYVLLRYHRTHPKTALVLAAVSAGLYAGVVIHNARLIHAP